MVRANSLFAVQTASFLSLQEASRQSTSGICRGLVVFAVVLASGLIGPAPADAQYQHSETLISPNPQLAGSFGSAVANIGDVTGDGVQEILVAAPGEKVRSSEAGRAYVFDVFGGDSEKLLYRLESPNPEGGGRFGAAAAGVGDVDGDGVGDILIGAPGETVQDSSAGRAYLFSGADGKHLRGYESPTSQEGGRFGKDVAAVGDLTGDDIPELLIGAPGEDVWSENSAGRAYLFNGAAFNEPPPNDSLILKKIRRVKKQLPEDPPDDEEIPPITRESITPDSLRRTTELLSRNRYKYAGLHSFNSDTSDPITNAGFGWAVAGLGDINSDGVPDMAVGAPGEPVGRTEGAGTVYFISGADRQVLETLHAPTPLPRDFFGNDVAVVSDVNEDSVPDVIVGASRKSGVSDGTSKIGKAYFFSGSDGQLLRTSNSPNAEKEGRFGDTVEGIGDIDGDGAGDALIGAPWEAIGDVEAAGRAYLVSGQSGLLQTFSPSGKTKRFGASVTSVKTSGDGRPPAPPNLFVGAPLERARGVLGAGRVHRFKPTPRLKARRRLAQARAERLSKNLEQTQDREEKHEENQKAGRQTAVEEETTSQVDTQIPETQLVRPDDIAVIIGNKKYKHTDIPHVKYAIRDAQVVKKYLIRTLGFREKNVIYVENASAAAMTRIFGTESSPNGQLSDWVKSNQSDVFVYYSGHGAPSPESGDAYFIPTDVNPSYLSQNGYPVNQLYENLAHLPASSVTVVLEACFSGVSEAGAVIPEISPAVLSVENPIMRLENGLAFTAGAADQVSTWYSEKKHGLFTYYFLKGLRGAANSNDDRAVTAREMEMYLAEEVPYRARRLHGREQTPQVLGQAKDRTLVRYEKEVPADR
jgi:hypothetical protein